MRNDRITTRLQTALGEAQSLAVGRDHAAVEPLHLLSALLKDGGSAALLGIAGVDAQALMADVQRRIDDLPRIGRPTGEVAVSSELARILNLADREAQRRGDEFLSAEVVLTALGGDAAALETPFGPQASMGLGSRLPSTPPGAASRFAMRTPRKIATPWTGTPWI